MIEGIDGINKFCMVYEKPTSFRRIC